MENTEIVNFLKDVIVDIESGNVKDLKLQYVGEFLMGYKFHEFLEDECNTTTEDEKDFLKFLFLGWYIYTFILRNNKSSIKNIKIIKSL